MEEKVLPPSRHLYLHSDVDEISVGELIRQIDEINDYDAKIDELTMMSMQNVYIEAEGDISMSIQRQPIILHVNTCGGSIRDGLALINAIKGSGTPIYSLVEGKAMSMGFVIALSCEYRMGYINSSWMYHNISSYGWGDLENQKRNIKEMDVLIDILDDIIVENTYLEKEDLDPIKKLREDWYMRGWEAMDLGIVDELMDAEMN